MTVPEVVQFYWGNDYKPLSTIGIGLNILEQKHIHQTVPLCGAISPWVLCGKSTRNREDFRSELNMKNPPGNSPATFLNYQRVCITLRLFNVAIENHHF